MINFLHYYTPQSILLSLGAVKIHWYGLIISLAITAALLLSCYLGEKYYDVKRDSIFDLSFNLIMGGIIGARIYDVLLQFNYYWQNPIDIFKVWQGGLAIHGAIIAGLLITYNFSKKNKVSFIKITSLLVPGLALGQAIGRFGNYFNQELFGLPSTLPWSIPIAVWNRPVDYLNYSHFHPTFLYESLACLIIFFVLIVRHIYAFKNNKINNIFFAWSLSIYMILYSVVRFLLEFIRLDPTPSIFGLRWPQIMSLLIILASIIFITKYKQNVLQKK